MLRDLVGKDLSGWKIVEMTEVYSVDEDGRKGKSLGYFRDPTVAEAFAGDADSNWHKTALARVLLNDKGETGFLFSENQDPVKLFKDEEEVARLRQAAIAKLSSAERTLLKV
jgi:Xaa-Pro aminopeptidase